MCGGGGGRMGVVIWAGFECLCLLLVVLVSTGGLPLRTDTCTTNYYPSLREPSAGTALSTHCTTSQPSEGNCSVRFWAAP